MDTPYPNPISPSTTRIGWIGIGVMGGAMASRLLSAGYTVAVYARSPSKAASLQSQGAHLASSPFEVARRSDVVFTMVGHPSDVRSVVLESEGRGILAGLSPGGVMVDTTTSDPALAREIFAAARAKGCWSVDSPVSGGDIGARDGKLAIFAGGDEGVVDLLSPLYQVLGKVTYMGGAGCGQSCKIANQIVVGANLLGLSEGLVFAEKAGLDARQFMDAVRGGAAGSMAMELFGGRMIGRDFRPGGFAEYMVKDMGMGVDVVEESEDEKVPVLPGAALGKQLFVGMVANGDGHLGTQGLITVIERLNGKDKQLEYGETDDKYQQIYGMYNLHEIFAKQGKSLYYISTTGTSKQITTPKYGADNLRISKSTFIEHLHVSNAFTEESIEFQTKVIERSGIGNEAGVPISMHELPPDTSIGSAREEVEEVLFTIVTDLLSKHNINPKSIDILISNCSLFCPTPSITAMIINKFRFRSNIKSFSLSGMGCSAGLLSISLAKELLKVHKNSLALVLSMEAMSPSGYEGKVKSMLVANTIFRMGGAAILLSNKKRHKLKARYKLQHLVRTHMGSDDESFCSVYQQADECGFVGVSLSKALLQVAGNALRTNISELGPLVLPYSEQIQYGLSVIRRKLWFIGRRNETYVPNFKKAFQHFCIHAGGRAVIDGVENNLKLQREDGEASRMTLHRFGNTSSSSVWYELCYLEAKGKVKKGDRIWQIAFGSGFKCNSAVWQSVSDRHPEERNAWSGTVHSYPVHTQSAPS